MDKRLRCEVCQKPQSDGCCINKLDVCAGCFETWKAGTAADSMRANHERIVFSLQKQLVELDKAQEQSVSSQLLTMGADQIVERLLDIGLAGRVTARLHELTYATALKDYRKQFPGMAQWLPEVTAARIAREYLSHASTTAGETTARNERPSESGTPPAKSDKP